MCPVNFVSFPNTAILLHLLIPIILMSISTSFIPLFLDHLFFLVAYHTALVGIWLLSQIISTHFFHLLDNITVIFASTPNIHLFLGLPFFLALQPLVGSGFLHKSFLVTSLLYHSFPWLSCVCLYLADFPMAVMCVSISCRLSHGCHVCVYILQTFLWLSCVCLYLADFPMTVMCVSISCRLSHGCHVCVYILQTTPIISPRCFLPNSHCHITKQYLVDQSFSFICFLLIPIFILLYLVFISS